MNKPAVDGIVNGVTVDIAKSLPGLFLIYLRVPFVIVSQLSAGVVKTPSISMVRVLACEEPLSTVTTLNIVLGPAGPGNPGVCVIEALFGPKKVTGTTLAPFEKLTQLLVCDAPFPTALLVLFIRLPPILRLWLFAPPHPVHA